LDSVPLEPEAVHAALQACQLAPGLEEPRDQGVEAQQGRLGARPSPARLLTRGRLRSFFGLRRQPREEDSQEKRDSERQPEREAALLRQRTAP